MNTTVDIPAMADQEIKRHQVCGTWASRRIDSDGCTAPLSHELCIRLDALAAERDRLRSLLDECLAIARMAEDCCDSEFRVSTDPPCERCADLDRIAAALAPGTPVDVE